MSKYSFRHSTFCHWDLIRSIRLIRIIRIILVKLSIYSLKKILFAGDASLLNCKTMVGEITVLDNHEPYIGVLTAGVMRVADSQNKEHFFEVASGFLEVKQGNEVRCIVE